MFGSASGSDPRGVCKCAVGMSVPSANYSDAQMVDKLLPLLREAAQQLRPLL